MPYAEANGTRLYYEQVGSGPPVLLIPGLGLDHTYYSLGLPALSAEFTTISIDPRGVGRSNHERRRYSIELWADDVAALITTLGHDNVHLLGTSLGGSIALSVAVRYPRLVRTLTVVGAFSELNYTVELNYSLRKRLINLIGMNEEMADFISLWIMSPAFLESDQGQRVATNIRDNVKHNDPELYSSFLDAILELGRPDDHDAWLTASLATIAAPTLVACADNDHFIPAKLSQIIHQRIPHSKFVEIPAGGHIPFIEAPDTITKIVIEFLTENE